MEYDMGWDIYILYYKEIVNIILSNSFMIIWMNKYLLVRMIILFHHILH